MKSLALSIFLIVLLLGCSHSIDPNYTQDYSTISGMDVKSAISLANDWKFSNPKITSHITPQELIVDFPDGRQVKKQLPADEMYIAVAPYINSTHTCETHYPSSCQGELTEKTFQLTAKDDSGNTLLDEAISTMKNGFFELWLPRNKTIQLHITYNLLSADETIGTFSNSKTCITTANLK
jgi:hypothetical protein